MMNRLAPHLHFVKGEVYSEGGFDYEDYGPLFVQSDASMNTQLDAKAYIIDHTGAERRYAYLE